MRSRFPFIIVGAIFAFLSIGTDRQLGSSDAAQAQGSWRGLTVAPERRCSPYDSDDYRYPQSVEDGIIREIGGVYGPYTGRWFAAKSETDIEHMVARSEAHDSGLCAADAATRRRFATDPLNLTLAGPRVNRYQKSDRDAADWLPAQNRCWFAARVVAVRQRYGLTIDRREANALDEVLAGCARTNLIVFDRGETPTVTAPAAGGSEVIAEWDDNRNGRISCAEARAHGIAPVTREHPAYPFMRDGDGDGVVCESGRRSPSAASPQPARGGACGPYRNCTALRRDHPNGVSRGHCAYQRRMDRDMMGEPVNARGEEPSCGAVRGVTVRSSRYFGLVTQLDIRYGLGHGESGHGSPTGYRRGFAARAAVLAAAV